MNEEVFKKIESLVTMFLPLIFMNQMSVNKLIITIASTMACMYIGKLLNYLKRQKIMPDKYKHFIIFTDKSDYRIILNNNYLKTFYIMAEFLSTIVATDLLKSLDNLYVPQFEQDVEFKYNSVDYKISYQIEKKENDINYQTIKIYSQNINDIKNLYENALTHYIKN